MLPFAQHNLPSKYVKSHSSQRNSFVEFLSNHFFVSEYSSTPDKYVLRDLYSESMHNNCFLNPKVLKEIDYDQMLVNMRDSFGDLLNEDSDIQQIYRSYKSGNVESRHFVQHFVKEYIKLESQTDGITQFYSNCISYGLNRNFNKYAAQMCGPRLDMLYTCVKDTFNNLLSVIKSSPHLYVNEYGALDYGKVMRCTDKVNDGINNCALEPYVPCSQGVFTDCMGICWDNLHKRNIACLSPHQIKTETFNNLQDISVNTMLDFVLYCDRKLLNIQSSNELAFLQSALLSLFDVSRDAICSIGQFIDDNFILNFLVEYLGQDVAFIIFPIIFVGGSLGVFKFLCCAVSWILNYKFNRLEVAQALQES